jgi:hypothetical protein
MQPRFLSIVRISLMLLVSSGLGLLTAAGEEQTAPASTSPSAAKIDQLLADSGYKFVKKTDSVWYIPSHGKSLGDYKVILAAQDDLLVTFVTVVKKARLPVTTEFVLRVLKFNNSLDFVKVGLDRDGDLFVRCDSSVRILDVKELKAVVEQVSASTNEVYEGVLPSLISE